MSIIEISKMREMLDKEINSFSNLRCEEIESIINSKLQKTIDEKLNDIVDSRINNIVNSKIDDIIDSKLNELSFEIIRI